MLPVFLILASCTQSGLPILETSGYAFRDGGKQFGSLEVLCTWINSAISYDTDSALWGYNEYWASPEETLAKGSGDCDDDAILFMYFAHTRDLALDPELVAVEVTPAVGHAIVRVGDMYYDPTNGLWGPFGDIASPILFTMTYDTALFVATHGHDESKSLGGARGVLLESRVGKSRSLLDTPCYNSCQTSSKESRNGVALPSSASLKACGSSHQKVDTLWRRTARR